MSKKLVLIYKILLTLFIIFVIIWFSIKLIMARDKNMSAIELNLYQLKERIISYYTSSRNSFRSEEFINKTSSFVYKDKKLKALFIYSDTYGLQFYAYEKRDEFLKNNPSQLLGKPFSASYNLKPMFEAIFHYSLEQPIKGKLFLKGFWFDAIYEVVYVSDIKTALREILIAVFVFLILTGIFLGLLTLAGPEERKGEAMTTEMRSSKENAASPKPLIKITAPGISQRESISPVSGLCYEQQFENRLNTELKRSTTLGQELILALLQFKNLIHYGEKYKAISRIILNMFKFHDLAFEYGESGFILIFPNAELATAIESMRALEKKIQEEFDISFGMGLTARNQRAIKLGDLLIEAKTALNKALSAGKSSIIAFKPDPRKYAQFKEKYL